MSKDTLYPLDSAALSMAHEEWKDTEAHRALVAEVGRFKYPGQPAPLINGKACEEAYLVEQVHEAELEWQNAIDSSPAQGMLTLVSPNTLQPTSNRQGAYVSRDELLRLMGERKHLGEFTIPRVHGTLTMNGQSFEEYRAQRTDRLSKGRYTLEEAALLIEQEKGERAADILDKLLMAVHGDVLAMFEPGKQARYKPKTSRPFFEKAYWEDLNHWLESTEPRIRFRFPDPKRMPTSLRGTNVRQQKARTG